jgi:large subunit ribosomal protein L25
MPEHIDLDVSGMEIGGTLRISDLTAPEGATLLDDPEMVVATVTAPTKVVEPEPSEEELAALEAEGEEGEEPTEGEAAEGAAGEPAEPDADAAGDQGTVEG